MENNNEISGGMAEELSKKEDYKFSVLMSIYYKENPEWFTTALDSIINQTLRPDEIVLVEDGPLTDELYQVIEEYNTKYSNLFKIVPLEKNSGLGNALRVGVLNCSYEFIARMDTDDIAREDRFEKQIQYLKEHKDIDVVGSWVTEFEQTPDNVIAYRNLPVMYNDVYKYAKFRCPLSHMSVVMKKSVVIDSGNYIEMKFVEDYYLWARILNNGYKIANISEYLVNVRAGDYMLKRRANLSYFFNGEYQLQKELLNIKFINNLEFLKNVISKFLLRALPYRLMALIYRKFLRNTGGSR